jgi:cbb3-type cytochrome oxidase maturation protein
MEVLVLLVFVSLTLAGSAVGLFAWLARQRTFQHGERLALLPLDDDARPRRAAAPTE